MESCPTSYLYLSRFKHLKPSSSSSISISTSSDASRQAQMTVTRSRKVVSVVQNEQSQKPDNNEVQLEPSTPAKEIESTNKSSSDTTSSPHTLIQSSGKLGSASSIDSVSVSHRPLRRSLRLFSKSNSSSYDVVENVSSRRKRKVVNRGKGEAHSVNTGSDLVLSSGIEKESVKVLSSGIEKESGSVRVSSELDSPNVYEANKEEEQSVKEVKIRRLMSPDLQFVGFESVQEGDVENNKNLTLEGKEGSSSDRNGGEKTLKRFTREDKQKDVLVNGDDIEKMEVVDDVNDTIEEETEKGKVTEVGSSSIANTVNLQHETTERATTSNRNVERFKNIARENAARFAHFSLQKEQEDDEEELEQPQTEANEGVEDWPGPFSTAMKIIKDRASNTSNTTGQQNTLTSDKSQTVPLLWVPKKKQKLVKNQPPSLKELCMSIMAENVDAITSLESVPDALRHKLTQLLCDCRKMNHHFFDLLASGTPSEIRVRDCSWLSEEQLTTTLKKTDTSKLTVLQLDQCGRCLPDYVLFTTLGQSNLSELTNISLRGACRLSDAGLNVLLTSTPSLRSINLGCCSLLTSEGIMNLSDKLGSILKELYIDECFGIDPKKILPALIKIENLEVLSISRFETVNDTFIKQLVGVRGHNIKELILADCTKLTDKSLKAIAESCPGLCSIDLSNLCKLTDTAIGHLANGCQGIQSMKFCRNTFSDEAVAAYIEACGRSLKELSLNHVDKVANHTALSLAKHARNLQSLDLSWCRNLTNEAVGLIVDSCLSLKTLKLFGCTQITDKFLDGYSNEEVKVIGLQGSQILKNIEVADLLPLRYSSAT